MYKGKCRKLPSPDGPLKEVARISGHRVGHFQLWMVRLGVLGIEVTNRRHYVVEPPLQTLSERSPPVDGSRWLFHQDFLNLRRPDPP